MSEEKVILFKRRTPKAGLRGRPKVTENRNEGQSDSQASVDSILKGSVEPQDDEDEFGVDLQKLEEMRDLREMKRKQSRGLSAEQLLSLGTGSGTGIVPVRKAVGLTTADALASDLDLGKTFSVETNRRDEDADMLKFIEEELAKRKGKMASDSDPMAEIKITENLNDLVFNVLPEHLLKSNEKKTEEMLSNQMLSGIPEVDLGVLERIRNIEATEQAKQKMIKKGGPNAESNHPTRSDSAATSASYMQHNKFNLGESNAMRPAAAKKPRVELPMIKVVKEAVVVIGDEPKESLFKVKPTSGHHMLKFPGREKPTDDYHYEKFKKSFRK
jgi:hypothetical protein